MLVSALLPADFRCAKMPICFSCKVNSFESWKTRLRQEQRGFLSDSFQYTTTKHKQLERSPLRHKESNKWSTTPPEHLDTCWKKNLNFHSGPQHHRELFKPRWSASSSTTKPAKRKQITVFVICFAAKQTSGKKSLEQNLSENKKKTPRKDVFCETNPSLWRSNQQNKFECIFFLGGYLPGN